MNLTATSKLSRLIGSEALVNYVTRKRLHVRRIGRRGSWVLFRGPARDLYGGLLLAVGIGGPCVRVHILWRVRGSVNFWR